VDPDKFKNLTESQKKEVVEKSKEARDTALESKKIHDEVAETAEKVVKVLEVAKDVGEVAQKALSQKEQNLWKDPVLEKLKAEEKAKKDKEKK
jgi:predicted CoA-binding protein